MGSTTPIPAAGLTPDSFAADVLKGIGAPVDAGNVGFVEAWEAAEGGNWQNSARFNPLNTSLMAGGSVNYQTGRAGGGVQAYGSWAQGLGATLSTLLEGPYKAVVSALRADSPADAKTALAASPWDAGHYAGGFPTSAAGAAYAKAHAGKSGGGGGIFSTIGTVAGDVAGLADPVTGAIQEVTHIGNPVSGLGKSVAEGVASGFGSLLSPVKDFVITGLFAGLGIALVVAGGYQTVKPAVRKAEQVATTAAAAAAV